MKTAYHGIVAAGLLILAVVLFLWGSVARHSYREEIAATQRELKTSRAKLQTLGGLELRTKLEQRRAETRAFREQLLNSEDGEQLEATLAGLGVVSKVEDVDLGEYRRASYRIQRSEGPVADWVPLSRQLVSLQSMPGLVVRSLHIEAAGDRESRRLRALSVDVAVFRKKGPYENEP
jgi:hypothetical protein